MSSKSDKIPNDIKSFLRSVLISSNGVKESRVQKDYQDLIGEKLMWKNYGFSSLNEFLNALPDVCVLQYSAKDKENRVYAVQKEGIYMSSHAKKNVKTANATVSDAKETIAPVVDGRVVQKDGDSFKITLSNNQGSEDDDGLIPNKYGLYQVYVTKLPDHCTEKDLKECFMVYGNVVEHQVVKSSIKKKIGFVRYGLKSDALRALSEGKKNPPKIHGIELEIGKPKQKSNSSNSEPSVSSEPSEGSLSSTPSSPIKNTTLQTATPDSPSKNKVPTSPTHPTIKPPSKTEEMFTSMNPPFNTQTPLSVEVPTSPQHSTFAQATNTKGTWTLDPKSPTKTLLSLHPGSQNKPPDKEQLVQRLAYGVVISGYNSRLSEANLKRAFQDVGSLERFAFQPLVSTAWFKTEDGMKNAVSDLNGKYIQGSVLLVKPLTRTPPVLDEKNRRNVEREEKLPEFGNEFLKIYDFYIEAISRCCGQQYLNWLNDLPSIFEVKIMDLIDPCTFWAHLSDGSDTYLEFNELTKRLSFINESSGGSYLNKNEFGAGKYSDDGYWYRCYCREVSKDGRRLLVMYIDYGNTEWLEREKTVKLSGDFFDLRPQGVLVKLSGLSFKSNNDRSLDDSVLSSARNLLIVGPFSARKAFVDSSKPFLLEIDLLRAKGEKVIKDMTSLPGVKIRPRQSSPVPPLLLSVPPGVPPILKPIKAGLSDVNTPSHLIWITNIKSPTAFHFQLVREESTDAIRRIQEMLLKCNIQNKVNVKDPKSKGLVCYHKNGLERSRVTFINSSTTPGKVRVLHVDTGKESLVLEPLTSFIALPAEARNIPFQARPALLFGVPHDTLARSSEALKFMISQATKVLRAIVVEEHKDESVVVELFNSDGASVNKKLLEMANIEQELSNGFNPSQQILSQSQETTNQNYTLSSQNPAVSKNELAAVKSAGTSLVMSSHSQISANTSGQALPIQKQSLDQESPNQTFNQGQISPDQAFGQIQAKPSQVGTQSRPSPNQVFAQSKTTPDQPLTNNRTVPTNRNFTQSQSSPNSAFGQNQPSFHQACSPNQAPPNRAFPTNHPPPQGQAASNQALSQALPAQALAPKQALSQGQISHNQNIASNQPPHNQAFTQTRVPGNQGFSPSQPSPQNQASSTQPFPKQTSGQGQISPSSLPPQNQATIQNQATTQNQAQPHRVITGQKPQPNQAFNRESTIQNQNHPHYNQAFPHSRVLPNQTPPQNQARPNQSSPQNITPSWASPTQSQPAPTRNINGPANRLSNTVDSASNIFPQRAAPQHDRTDRPPMPNSRFYDSRRPNASQKDFYSQNLDVTSANVGTTSQGIATQGITSQRVTSQGTTSQRYPSQANAPKGFASHDTLSQKTTAPVATSKAVTSQVASSHTFTSQMITSSSVSSHVPTSHAVTTSTIASQVTSSQNVSSQGSTLQIFTSNGAARQPATSQSSTLRGVTLPRSKSNDTTSPSTASHGIASKSSSSLTATSETMTSQGTTSSLTQFSKTRSDSSASTESKNSVNSEENWDEADTNVEHEAKTSLNNVNEVRSKSLHVAAGSDRQDNASPTDKRKAYSFNKLQSTKPRSPTPRRKPFLNDVGASSSKTEPKFKNSTGFGKIVSGEKRSNAFTSTESGTSKMGSSAEWYARGFSGRGGKKSFLPGPGVSRHAKPSFDAVSIVRPNSRKIRDLKEKVTEQEKVLACSGKELESKVEMYKKRAKLEMEYRIKMLENENLMLEVEIKKNLEEKAKLEKQLLRQ